MRRIRRIVLLISLAAVVGAAILVMRGPHISNALKKVILPELESISGRKVIAQKIYVNIFPLFVEAKEVKAFDEGGERILSARRVKAYLDLLGLLEKRVIIRRLVIREPEVTVSREQVEDIVRHVQTYLATVRENAVNVKVRALEIQKGDVGFSDMSSQMTARMKGLKAEMAMGDTQRLMMSADVVGVKKEGWPEITADAAANLAIRDTEIEIKNLVVGSLGSRLAGAGEFGTGKGRFTATLDLLVSSVKKLFGLAGPGEGRLKANGSVEVAGKNVTLDLKVGGSFYLQTLMEFLKVKEKVEGMAEVNASLRGPLSDLKGRGTATLRKGNLFDVAVDSLNCTVAYEKGTIVFTEGAGRLYGGTAKLSASIALPVVNFFTLNVDFTGVDSGPLFKLIGWDPGLGPGKAKGTLASAGADFNPEGQFEYVNPVRGRDVLGRVSALKGRYRMQGSVIALNDLAIETAQTKIDAGGSADIGTKTLNFQGHLHTRDVTDLSSPFYDKLKGEGDFRGTVTGTFDDPVLSGHLIVSHPAFEHYAVSAIDGEVTYRKNALEVKDVAVTGPVELSRVSGRVHFREAKALFDFAAPAYELSANLKNADLDKFARIFYPDFKGSGRLHADMKIGGKGDRPTVRGTGSLETAELYGIALDSASFGWGFEGQKLTFAGMKITRGKSILSGDLSVETGGVFSYHFSSERLLLSDMVQRPLKGEAVMSLTSEGHGTFDDPSVVFSGRIIEGMLKGKPVGSGSLYASIKNRDISASALLLNDRVKVTAHGRFEKEIPWQAKVNIETARYDAVLSAFLKDVPEDLILSLNGTVMLNGDRGHVSASAVITQLSLSMYGYTFSNDRELTMELKDRELSLNRISLRSGGTSLTIGGGLQFGKGYNVTLEGSSSLAPFKSLSTRIGLLRGDADFVLSVTGSWEAPQINGGVTLTNGSFGLKDYTYRVSSINGYLYMDNDRIILQKLSGKMGGGDIDVSGSMYLQKFALKRFYVEAGLKNVSISPARDFTINFDGTLLYKGTPASQGISGDVKINRARYRERIEWKSWLLEAKKTERFKPEITNLEKAELNIRIAGKDNIVIDNNVGRATMNADMVLRGTVYRPVLLGRIDTNEGTVYFRNNEFRILHASAGFFDPNRINPIIQIAAETSVKGYRIKLNLEGQTDHFTVSFSSDPLLKEADILSLLAVGQTSAEVKGLEGGIGAGEATSFVTGKMQDVVEERMRSITGLDRFQLDSYVSKKSSTVQPRVTVSKRLLGDKFFVTYGSSVGSTEEQIIKLEYFLSRNVSLVGLRDERGIVGGDVRYRFEFK